MSYGSAHANYAAQIDEEKNYLCNGDFEDPPVPDGKDSVILGSNLVPCWVAT